MGRVPAARCNISNNASKATLIKAGLTPCGFRLKGDIKNVFSTIKNGVVEKGMPAWGKSMRPEAVRDVTFFVMSLQGTNPQNAKAPQGEIFKEATEKSDSTKVQASL